MDITTKLKVKVLLAELLNDQTTVDRKRSIISELRDLNGEFDDAIAKLGIENLLMESSSEE